jgi:hypothetical protein
MPNALLEAKSNRPTQERKESLSGYPDSSSRLLNLHLSDKEQPHPS